jgi:phenylalanyl-tRNA synthetase beta chain
VRAAAGEQLAQFTCFDVYAGEGIDSEKKSIGLGLTFQHLSRTLEEAEVSTFVATVMQRLEAQFGASQR